MNINKLFFLLIPILILLSTTIYKFKKTIILVTHDTEFANYSSRKITLVDGEIQTI